MRGLVLFNKPRGWRNRDIILFFRRLSQQKRVGHGGTLDPAAEGLVVVGLGRTATKTLTAFLTRSQKTYQATLRLGARSATGDAEGEVVEVLAAVPPTLKRIKTLMKEKFSGEYLQSPPLYSALKIRGQRARDRAARGEVVELTPRLVRLEAWRLLNYSWPELKLELTVSSGFYIRSLAVDLGEALETGAYLLNLVRTEISRGGSRYKLERALGPNDLDQTIELITVVNGAVQGVGFRQFSRAKVGQLGLVGSVKNQPDGSVAICVQGQRSQLEQFQATIESGPGQIKRVDYLWQRPAESFDGFIIQ